MAVFDTMRYVQSDVSTVCVGLYGSVYSGFWSQGLFLLIQLLHDSCNTQSSILCLYKQVTCKVFYSISRSGKGQQYETIAYNTHLFMQAESVAS